MEVKNKSDVLAIIEEFNDQIKKDYSVDSLYLFGSYSYGNPDIESDIDLAVILNEKIDDKIDFEIFVKAQRISLDLETVSFTKVDFENEKSDLIIEIKKKGEKVA